MKMAQNLPHFALATIICLIASGCTGPPQGTSITGESGGCGDFVAYRFNQSRTLAVVITVDGDKLKLSEEPTLIILGPGTTDIRVDVYQFKEPAGTYFCDDVGGDPEPIANWSVISGSVSITRKVAQPPANLSNATHKISVVLKNATIKHNTTSAVADFGDDRLDYVWVGWYAG